MLRHFSLFLLIIIWSIETTFVTCQPSNNTTNATSTTVIDVLSRDPAFRQFIYALQRTHIIPYINSMPNCTLFALKNEDMKELPEDQVTSAQLLYHSLDSVARLDLLRQSGGIFESLWIWGDRMGKDRGQRILVQSNTTIINPGWDGFLQTGKPVRIVEGDLVASRGVVHVVDGLFKPPDSLENITRKIPGMENLLEFMDKANMSHLLAQPFPITLFVPKNPSFSEQLPGLRIGYLTHPRGFEDLALTVGHHVSSGPPIFTSELPLGGQSSVNMTSGEALVINKTTDGVFINNGTSQIEITDIFGNNGVIHLMDKMVLPSELSFNALKLMHAINGTSFVDLLIKNGLDYRLNKTDEALTVIVPPNHSIKSLKAEEGSDKNRLLYHIFNDTSQLNLSMKSRADPAERETLLIRTLLKGPRTMQVPLPVKASYQGGQLVEINGRKVIATNEVIGNVTLLQVEEYLPEPPNPISLISENPSLSSIHKAVFAANQRDRFNAPGLTYFLPLDDSLKNHLGLAFDSLFLPGALLKLQKAVKSTFTVDEIIFSDALMPNQTKSWNSVNGDKISFSKDINGQLWVSLEGTNETLRVIESDVAVDNGVVHFLDGMLLTPEVTISVVDLMKAAGAEFFLDGLKKVGLGGLLERVSSLNGPFGFTFLTPSDAAFAPINSTLLLDDLVQLRRLLMGHVIPGQLDSNPDGSVKSYKNMLGTSEVLVRKGADGVLQIGLGGQWANVVRKGQARQGGWLFNGSRVYELDRVLEFPEGAFWWWFWIILLFSIFTAAATGVWHFLYRKRGISSWSTFKAWWNGYAVIPESQEDPELAI